MNRIRRGGRVRGEAKRKRRILDRMNRMDRIRKRKEEDFRTGLTG